MAAKKKTASKSKTPKATEPQDEYAAQPEAPVPPKVNSGPTLSDAASAYLVALDNDGAGTGTLSSYRMELQLAMREIGEDTLLAELTPERVREYFDCDAVMLTKQGKPKAKPTFDKSRRVLRLCLMHAQDAGLIEVAPIPAPATKPVKLQAV